MLRVLIIEDEIKSRDVLRNLIHRFCPDVHIVGEASTVMSGAEIIRSEKPDLVFLDIELPEKNGFALFDYFDNPPFEVIFTTAYDNFAIQAFRISAIDYLLKPINFQHLQSALKKVMEKKNVKGNKEKIEILTQVLNDEKIKKIALPVSNGYQFIDIEMITYCRAERNYSRFFLSDGKSHLVSKPLGYFEDILCESHFIRINRSIIINLNYISGYSRSLTGEVIMTNDERFTVSNAVKKALFKKMNIPSN